MGRILGFVAILAIVALVGAWGLTALFHGVQEQPEGEIIAERAKTTQKNKDFSKARQLWVEAREKGASERICRLNEGKCALATGECLHAMVAAETLLKIDPLDYEATKLKEAALTCSGITKKK